MADHPQTPGDPRWADPLTEERLLGALIVAEQQERWHLLAQLGDTPGFTDEVRHQLFVAIRQQARTGSEHLDDNELRRRLAEASVYNTGEGIPVAAWLMRLVEDAPVLTSEHEAAAAAVLRLAQKRRMRGMLDRHLMLLADPAISPDDLRATAVAEWMANPAAGREHLYPSLWTLTDQIITNIENRWERGGQAEYSTGSKDLDRRLDGFTPGHTLIIAARPSIGKTAVALDMARSLLKQGLGVLFFSLEMSPAELWHRIVAAEASFNAVEASSRKDEAQFEAAQLVMGDLAGKWGDLLKVTDGNGEPLTLTRIEAEVHSQVAIWKAQGITPGAFFVDYIQNVPADKEQRRDSEYDRVTETSRRLSRLGRDTSTTPALLSQLKRPESSARRVDPPTMEMLRSSGQLEQDADIVLLLHRPDFYDPEERPGEIDYIIGKSRHTGGAGHTVSRVHRLEYYQFFDRARTSEPADNGSFPAGWDAPPVPPAEEWKD